MHRGLWLLGLTLLSFCWCEEALTLDAAPLTEDPYGSPSSKPSMPPMMKGKLGKPNSMTGKMGQMGTPKTPSSASQPASKPSPSPAKPSPSPAKPSPSPANPSNAARCPENMVLVPGVVNPTTKKTYDACVDAYEAYLTTESGQPWAFNQAPPAGTTFYAQVAPNTKPQGYMSGDGAKAACTASSKRLCRLEEWLAACQGPQKYTYPYGNTYVAGRCNVGRSSNPVIDLFGKNAKFDSVQMNDPRIDLLPNTVANGGQFADCVSGYNAFDTAGNLDEWVDHINQPSGHGTFVGGYFVDGSINGPGCLYRTTAHVTSWHDYSLGFRCCTDASS